MSDEKIEIPWKVLGAGAFVAALVYVLWPKGIARKLSPDERVTGLPAGFSMRPARTRAEWAMSWRPFDDAAPWTPETHAPVVWYKGAPVPLSALTNLQTVNSPALAAPPDGKCKAGTVRLVVSGFMATDAKKTLCLPSSLVEMWNALNNGYASRKKTLPAGASAGWDRYSKEAYNVPAWLMRPIGAPAAGVVAFPTDEFGRIKAGHYGDGGGLWGATFGGLLKNPLFRFVVTTAIVAGGGPAGVAAIGAYTMWQNRARELNLKSVALSAARTYAVSQCGEACGTAFDFGVGVAGGRSVDDAAKDALKKQMSPEQRAYFEQGEDLTAKAGLRL